MSDPDYATDYVHPDLDKIKRLEVTNFFETRRKEFELKIKEVKPGSPGFMWLLYGWLLQTADDVDKLEPFVSDIPVLGFILKWYGKIMRFQAKRLGY